MNNAATVVHQLINAKSKAKENENGWKAEGKRIDGELAEIIKPEDQLRAAGKLKDGGSKTVEEYGCKFTLEASKDVKWDSAKLQAVAAQLPWAQVEHIFKIKFEISETVYKQLKASVAAGMFSAELMKQIDEARTFTVGEAKITKAEILPQ